VSFLVEKNLRPTNTNRGLKPLFVFIGLSVGVGGLWVMVVGGGDPGGEEGRRGRARHAAAMLSSPAKNVSCEQHVEFGAQPGGVGRWLGA